MWLVMYSPLYQ